MLKHRYADEESLRFCPKDQAVLGPNTFPLEDWVSKIARCSRQASEILRRRAWHLSPDDPAPQNNNLMETLSL